MENIKKTLAAKLLIVDDDIEICDSLTRVFVDAGHLVACAHTLDNALEKAGQEAFDVVFLDVRLPDGSGLDYLSAIKKSRGAPEVIVMTGYADVQGAEEAIKANAWDYLQKPVSLSALDQALENTLQYRAQKTLRDPLAGFARPAIVGESLALQSCLSIAAQCAANEANVLVTGESGTGKELLARAIHENSKRADRLFVVVDCSSLPDNLAESILMGHNRGAFTNAHRSETGLIKHADGGTLFLDEVGELPLAVQKAFLRVLENRRFRPVGDLTEVSSDFRLVSATNKDLDELVKGGLFREDLLFRLRSVTIRIPPLRERIEDIAPLARHHLLRRCAEYKVEEKELSASFIKVLETYPWPGNVRELFHTLDGVFALARDESILFGRHLPEYIRVHAVRTGLKNVPEPVEDAALSAVASEEPTKPVKPWKRFRRDVLGEAERKYLVSLMSQADGNVREASDISGLSVPRLYELLRKHKVKSRFVPE
ncbi:MAG: sigma-54 dependent transcriptional regulator [Desulfatibacillaceae bacterium]|nr:sigma-54 dependent transcriptional regulator [Desulfatibacillaceae bacterium]